MKRNNKKNLTTCGGCVGVLCGCVGGRGCRGEVEGRRERRVCVCVCFFFLLCLVFFWLHVHFSIFCVSAKTTHTHTLLFFFFTFIRKNGFVFCVSFCVSSFFLSSWFLVLSFPLFFLRTKNSILETRTVWFFKKQKNNKNFEETNEKKEKTHFLFLEKSKTNTFQKYFQK